MFKDAIIQIISVEEHEGLLRAAILAFGKFSTVTAFLLPWLAFTVGSWDISLEHVACAAILFTAAALGYKMIQNFESLGVYKSAVYAPPAIAMFSVSWWTGIVSADVLASVSIFLFHLALCLVADKKGWRVNA